MKCLVCDSPTGIGGCRGRSPKYCSNSCKQRAYRERLKNDAHHSTSSNGAPYPLAMTSAPNWVRADGKRPIQVDGRAASSTMPSTWSSFSEVLASNAGDGYGFMLGSGSNVGCHDLDNAFNDAGRLEPWAVDVLAAIESPIFVEVSQSGRGLHVFVHAVEVRGFRRSMPNGGGHEFYSRGRFIRTTGNVWSWF